MTAKINITTPAGKSLEGFPIECDTGNRLFDITEDGQFSLIDLVHRNSFINGDTINPNYEQVTQLTKGDIITIEVL